MTADRSHRSSEDPGDVLDEARLAAPGGPREHHGQALIISKLEQLDFVLVGLIESYAHGNFRMVRYAQISSRWTCERTRARSSTRRMRVARRDPNTSGSGST